MTVIKCFNNGHFNNDTNKSRGCTGRMDRCVESSYRYETKIEITPGSVWATKSRPAQMNFHQVEINLYRMNLVFYWIYSTILGTCEIGENSEFEHHK